MDATGQTYSYYFTRKYLPTMIFSLFCVALSLLLIPVQLLLKQSPILRRYFKTEFFIMLVFSTMLNKHRDRNGKTVYTILDYKVSKRYKVMMMATALSLIGVAGGLFWYQFLFEKSHICSTDPDLACFPAQPNLTTPLLDCSDTSYLEINNNITSVICYRYAYNPGTAIGAALGLTAVNALFTIIINLLLLKVSNGSEWTKCRAVLTVVIQLTTVTILAACIAILSYLTLKGISETIQLLIRITIQSCLIYPLVYSTVLFPWWSFKNIKIIEEEESEQESNGEYRRVRGTSIPII